MSFRKVCLLFCAIVASIFAVTSSSFAQNTCGTGSAYFASNIVSFAPGTGVTSGVGFGQPSRLLCAPVGGSDVLSLGAGGTVIAGFDQPIVDGPGTDFITFENGFAVGTSVFAEFAFVEVSTDGVNFVRFPSLFETVTASIGSFGVLPAGCSRNLAGQNLFFPQAIPTDYADPCLGGGDAFDLADLQTEPPVLAGTVDLSNIQFVRLVDVIGDGSSTDSLGRSIFDPLSAGASADMDAIAVVHHALNQVASRPGIEVTFDSSTRRIQVTVSDTDGLGDLLGPARISVNQVAVDVGFLFSLFSVSAVSTTSISFTSPPIAPGFFAQIAMSVTDAQGLRSSDVDAVRP